jgi:SulP family sulfate permease
LFCRPSQACPTSWAGCSTSYVSCGSLNRSLPNLEAGARSPLAAVMSALLVVPLVALSAPLLALITLAATLTLRLEIAVLIGSALSLGLYLHRTSRPALRTMGFDRDRADTHRPFVVVSHTPGALPECPQLKLLRMEGSVYFGATAHVADRLQALRDASAPQRHLLVMAKSMNFIDVAGAELWRQELRARRALGGDLYFHRPRPPVLAQWRRDGFLDELGADHVFPDKRRAIAAITRRLDCATCAACTVRVFAECAERPGPGCDSR